LDCYKHEFKESSKKRVVIVNGLIIENFKSDSDNIPVLVSLNSKNGGKVNLITWTSNLIVV